MTAWWILLYLVSQSGSSTAATWQEKKQELFAGYKAYSPPPNMGNPDPLVVTMGIAFNSMTYNIKTGFLDLEYWFRLRWRDERLLFEGNEVFGTAAFQKNPRRYIPVNLMEGDNFALWIPDVQAYNSSHFNEHIANENAQIYPKEVLGETGGDNVFLSRPGKMQVYCKANLTLFPFDRQDCRIHFASWIYSQEYLLLQTSENMNEMLISHPNSNEYMLDDIAYAKGKDLAYEAIPELWSGLDVTIFLIRLPMYYVLNAVVPMVIIVALSALTFYIPLNPDYSGSGERMSFSITCLLTIVAVDLFTCQNRPELADETWLDAWIATCLFATLVPIIETIMVFFLDGTFKSASIYTEDMEDDVDHSAPPVIQHIETLRRKDIRSSWKLMQRLIQIFSVCKPWATFEFGPRKLDRIFRHFWPLLITVLFAVQWWRIPMAYRGRLPWDNYSFNIMISTCCIIYMILVILGVLGSVGFCRKRIKRCAANCKDEDNEDDDEEVTEELSLIVQTPSTALTELPTPARRR